MPFGVGSVTTYFLRKHKYEQALRQKDAAIAFLDRELTKSILSEFSGVELVDATVALLDATVERYLRDADGIKTLRLIRLYLDKLEEVYKMNKDNLDNIPATRKEMLALGLAVRHMAVALDQEFASLKALKVQVNQALHEVRAASAEQAKSLERFQAEVNQEISRTRSYYTQQLESMKRIHERTRLLAYIGVGTGLLVGLFILLQVFVIRQS